MCLQTAFVWLGLSLLCLPFFWNNGSKTQMTLSPIVCQGFSILLLSLLCCCAGPVAALREV